METSIIDGLTAFLIGATLVGPVALLWILVERVSPELRKNADPFWGSVPAHWFLIAFSATVFYLAIGFSSALSAFIQGETSNLVEIIAVTPVTITLLFLLARRSRAQSNDKPESMG